MKTWYDEKLVDEITQYLKKELCCPVYVVERDYALVFSADGGECGKLVLERKVFDYKSIHQLFSMIQSQNVLVRMKEGKEEVKLK